MKKVFLSLITIFMVLSLSIVLVKAEGETKVELADGVQIRTDGNNGLKWVANVTNHKEGNEYGFLFAKGEFDKVTIDTPEVVNELVDGVTDEELTMKATMVNFPKAAATQDISVVAYAKDGENYTYSNVVVKNLSEVAVEAYKNGVEGDFVKEIYEASKTTFVIDNPDFSFKQYSLTEYNKFKDPSVMLHGKGRCNSSSSAAWISYYDRIYLKFDETLGLYKVVAVMGDSNKSDNWTYANYAGQDFDFVLIHVVDGKSDNNFVSTLFRSANVKNYLFDIESDVELDSETSTKNIAANINIKVFENKKTLLAQNNKFEYYGGGEKLPTPIKDHYDFAGWYDNNEFTGEKFSVQGKSRTLYAKFTPVEYTISYILNGGSCSEELVDSFNYESNEIVLPTNASMTIDDGTFIGWYDNAQGNGTPINSIPIKSFGNKVIYAIWQMDAPTEVVLSSDDKAIIEKNNPTIFVSSQFGTGKFNINGKTYEAGVNAFTSIKDAIAAADENTVIYVFSGTYDENITINVNGLTLLGANADVDPNTGARQKESSIKKLTVSANDIKFNGFKFINRLEAEGESILISAKVSNCTLAYSIIENQSEFNTNGNGLIKITGNAGQEVSNIIIQNFKVEKGSKRPTLIYGYGINNFTIKDSMFLGSNDSDLYTDAVKLGSSGNYGVKGTITITGNTFKDYGQYLIWIQKCDTAVINVSSNLFINNGQKSDTHGALRIASASSTFTEVSITMENNIINNSYMLFRVDNVAAFTASKFKAELHNNSILNSKANVHIKNESAGTINATNNYYDVTPTKEKFIGVSTWDPYLKEDPNK